MGLPERRIEAYPDFATKVAVLCWHLVNNHPLPGGNKRSAFQASVEFVEHNDRTWLPAPGDRTRPITSFVPSRAAS